MKNVNKVNIVLLIVLLVLICFYCCDRQPEEVAGIAETSTIQEQPEPAAEEVAEPEIQPVVPEPEPVEEPAPSPEPVVIEEPATQPEPVPPETPKPVVEEKVPEPPAPQPAPEPQAAPKPRPEAEKIDYSSFAQLFAADDSAFEKDQHEVVITSPEIISFYKSTVHISGHFFGFPDIAAAGWIIKETEHEGEISVGNDMSFDFSIDTSGFNNTLVVNVFAEDSEGKRAESLIVLVNDGIGPSVSISSPSNNSVYTTAEKITGTINGELKTAVMELLGSGIQIPLEISQNGRFSLELSGFFDGYGENSELPFNPIFKLTAEDNNLNITTEYLSLFSRSPGSGISVTSPFDGDYFDSGITVTGTAAGYRELSWDIPDTGFSGTIKTEDGGAFNYPLYLSGIADRMLFRLTAEGRDKTESYTFRMSDSRNTSELNITEPVNGGYYTNLIPLKGTVGSKDEDVFTTVKNLTWRIPGSESGSNLIFFEEDGSFLLDMSLYNYSGLLPIELKLDDYNNNTSRQILLLRDGKQPPEIRLSLPKPESEYGSFIDIVGTIVDPYEGTPFGGITEASYEIASTENFDVEPLTGKLELFEGNSFGIQLPALDMEGNQQLSLTASAANGNSITHTIEMAKSDTGITSFTLSAEEGVITAVWRPIQATEADYTLLLTDDGSVPSMDNAVLIKDAEPPVILNRIDNERLYSVKLIADTEYGLLESDVQQVIPAGPDTFRLKSEGAFKQIKLSWNPVKGAETYSIFRTDDSRAPFNLLTTGVTDSNYIDKEISYGRDYFYYITPDNHEYAKSGYVSGTMKKAPDERVIQLNELSTFIPVDIDVTGNYVYTAAGKDGFRIIDITSPEMMSVKGAMNDIEAYAVEVRGDYAYLACGPGGLNIVNIMDPGLPVITGKRTTVSASDVCLKDNIAYIADQDSGLKVIDIASSTSPERISTITDINSSIVYSVDNLLFSDDSSSLRVFDISDPAKPAGITEYNYNDIRDIIVEDNIAYLLSGRLGLIILDISDIKTPIQLSTLSLTNPAAFTKSGSFIYVADGRNGLKIINVSNLKKPVNFDSLKSGNTVAIDVSGENVIVAETTGLTTIQTFLQGVSFVINKFITTIRSTSIAIYKTLSFIPAKSDGLLVLDISSPESPVEVKANITPDYAGDIVIDGNDLYMCTADNAVSLFRIKAAESGAELSEPVFTVEFNSSIKNIHICSLPGNVKHIAVCCDDGTVSLINNGEITSTIESIAGRDCIAVNGTAYLSDNRAGLMIYNLETESGAPELTGSVEIERADFMLQYGKYILVAGRKGIFFYDVSSPSTPVQTAFIKTNYAENGVIKGNYLYLAEGYKGLTVYNLKDPLNPILISVCDTVYASDLAIVDDYAFIMDGTGVNTVKIFIPDWIK